MMIPWGGISCCLSGAALYLLGRSSGRYLPSLIPLFFPYYILLIINYVRAYRDAEVLKSVAKVNQLKELGMSYAPLTDLILLILSYRMFRECPFASAMMGF